MRNTVRVRGDGGERRAIGKSGQGREKCRYVRISLSAGQVYIVVHVGAVDHAQYGERGV